MKALCYLPETGAQLLNDLAIVVRTAGAMFVPCRTPEEVVAQIENDPLPARNFLLTDQDQSGFVIDFANRFPKNLIILGLKHQLTEVPPDLRNCLPIHSFVAYSERHFDPCDFLVTLNKFRTRDIFGVGKYLKAGTRLASFDIFNRDDKDRVIERLCDSVSYLGGNSEESRFHQYARRISDTVDELILNAIFSANPRFHEKSRNVDFALEEIESVRVEWGFDGDLFGLSVRDSFGLLTKETVLHYLDNALENEDIVHRTSGGLGLRSVYDRLHKLVVNVNPQFITEVVCLLRFDRRIRDFDSRIRSFHFFTL